MRRIKMGFVGFGEVNTPRELVERLCREALAQLPADECEVTATAPVSDDPGGRDVARAVAELRRHDFDVLLVCLAGWIPTHAVIGVIDHFRHIPMVLWGLAGWRDGERFITAAPQAGSTALRQPMADMGYTFTYAVQPLDGPPPLAEILDFSRAARAAALLRGARIGQMGFRDMNLYGTLYDGMSLRARIGLEIEYFEMLEIERLMQACPAAVVAEWRKKMLAEWNFTREPQPQTLENTIRLFHALREKIRERDYRALSFKDVDGVKKLLNFAPAGAMMLLHTAEPEICTIPENDSLGAATQLLMHFLTGQTAAYLEYYDFFTDGVLMGVPDYVPPQVVDGPVCVMPTAFGEFGEGLLNVSRIKTGPVTIARMAYTAGRYQLHMVTGRAEQPPAWEEAGWQPPAPQLPSLKITLDTPMPDFQQKVLGQHYILAYGDQSGALRGLCRILDIDVL
ncbi:MAG: hypothetical protein ABR497_00465 [Kiritimatiellia bacterium]